MCIFTFSSGPDTANVIFNDNSNKYSWLLPKSITPMSFYVRSLIIRFYVKYSSLWNNKLIICVYYCIYFHFCMCICILVYNAVDWCQICTKFACFFRCGGGWADNRPTHPPHLKKPHGLFGVIRLITFPLHLIVSIYCVYMFNIIQKNSCQFLVVKVA